MKTKTTTVLRSHFIASVVTTLVFAGAAWTQAPIEHSIEAPADPVGTLTSLKRPASAASTDEAHAWADVKVYVFKVSRGDNNIAVVALDGLGKVASNTSFDYGRQTAYKTEFGWTAGNKFGFRASYFYTKQRANDISRLGTAAPPRFKSTAPLNVFPTGTTTPGNTSTYAQNFRMDVGDIEATYSPRNERWRAMISAGVRIARYNQVYRAHDALLNLFFEDVRYEQKRTGAGPTGAVDLRYRLGNSDVSLIGSGRVAFLFRPLRETAISTLTDLHATTPFSTQTATRSSSPRTFVVEGEAGLEWEYKFSGRRSIFFNGSFIMHQWHDAVIGTPVEPVGSSTGTPSDDPAAPPTVKGSIRFLGGGFSVGFRF